MRFFKKHWLKIVSFLWAVIFIYFIFRLYSSNFFVYGAADPNKIIMQIRAYGILAPIAYIILFAVRPLILFPSSLFVLIAGIIFGKFWGSTYAVLGAMLSATLEFYMSRYLLRGKIEKLIKGRLVVADEAIRKHGFKTVFLIRFIPNVAFDIQNFGLGLTQIKFKDYFFGTLFGIIPVILFFVYFGYSLIYFKYIGQVLLVIISFIAIYFVMKYLKLKFNSNHSVQNRTKFRQKFPRNLMQ
jgi:uncharacterized membrane protein YdjX (TVP38/TMEM64 family)